MTGERVGYIVRITAKGSPTDVDKILFPDAICNLMLDELDSESGLSDDGERLLRETAWQIVMEVAEALLPEDSGVEVKVVAGYSQAREDGVPTDAIWVQIVAEYLPHVEKRAVGAFSDAVREILGQELLTNMAEWISAEIERNPLSYEYEGAPQKIALEASTQFSTLFVDI